MRKTTDHDPNMTESATAQVHAPGEHSRPPNGGKGRSVLLGLSRVKHLPSLSNLPTSLVDWKGRTRPSHRTKPHSRPAESDSRHLSGLESGPCSVALLFGLGLVLFPRWLGLRLLRTGVSGVAVFAK